MNLKEMFYTCVKYLDNKGFNTKLKFWRFIKFTKDYYFNFRIDLYDDGEFYMYINRTDTKEDIEVYSNNCKYETKELIQLRIKNYLSILKKL